MADAMRAKRCFFITANASERRSIFQSDRMCDLFLELCQEHRQLGRFQLHAFVLMPDHLHAILTPAQDVSLEKAMQFVKGRFSFEAKKQFGLGYSIWQKGFYEDRIVSFASYQARVHYIESNPVRARMVSSATEYAWSSAVLTDAVDPMPRWM